MIYQKNNPGNPESQGLKHETSCASICNIAGNRETANPFILNHERSKLASVMAQGRSIPFKLPFTGKHRIIYATLTSFLSCYPVQQHTARCFVVYLAENFLLEACGGEKYIYGIFQGIGGE